MKSFVFFIAHSIFAPPTSEGKFILSVLWFVCGLLVCGQLVCSFLICRFIRFNDRMSLMIKSTMDDTVFASVFPSKQGELVLFFVRCPLSLPHFRC